MDTADRSAGVLVGSGGDGTRIQYDYVGVTGRTGLKKALCRQLTLQGCAISLSGTAAKTLDKESGHEGYYNGAFAAGREQQLTTKAIVGCILLARFKAIQKSPWEFT